MPLVWDVYKDFLPWNRVQVVAFFPMGNFNRILLKWGNWNVIRLEAVHFTTVLKLFNEDKKSFRSSFHTRVGDKIFLPMVFRKTPRTQSSAIHYW